jgi:farnesyl diphosphate synthase
MSTPALADWMAARLADFECAAEAHLPPNTRKPTKLHAAMRVRPLLVYAAGEAMQAPEAALQAAALAVEYVHVYSLIHDDLPCMDNDILRRGKPTVHIAFDEATAMLAGDALQAEAFRVLAQATVAPAVQAALMGELAEAASTAGMCGGQAIDLDAVGSTMSLDDLEQMHLMKTGALLRAALRMGARAGGAEAAVLADLDVYARAIGLAFQVVDDVLDVEASSAELGKTAGKDAQQGKPTYVSMLGLTEAKAWSERLRRDAHRALDHLPETVRARTLRLRQLADFIVLRKS